MNLVFSALRTLNYSYIPRINVLVLASLVIVNTIEPGNKRHQLMPTLVYSVRCSVVPINSQLLTITSYSSGRIEFVYNNTNYSVHFMTLQPSSNYVCVCVCVCVFVYTRIYEGWNFNSGNYLFTTDTK